VASGCRGSQPAVSAMPSSAPPRGPFFWQTHRRVAHRHHSKARPALALPARRANLSYPREVFLLP
jgi:hypothetical protein